MSSRGEPGSGVAGDFGRRPGRGAGGGAAEDPRAATAPGTFARLARLELSETPDLLWAQLGKISHGTK